MNEGYNEILEQIKEIIQEKLNKNNNIIKNICF